MSAVSKSLAKPLNIKLTTQIDRLEKVGNYWKIYDKSGLAMGTVRLGWF